MASIHTDRGFDRLVNFTDAAVAIAITLLVLPLVDLVTEDKVVSVGDIFSENRATFIAFAISFVIIAGFWISHHRLFESLRDYSRGMMWANFLWLASIVFIPFTTQLVAEVDVNGRAVLALYIGTMVVATGSLTLILWLAVRNPELQSPEIRGALDVRGSLVGVGLRVLCLILAVLVPVVGLWWLLLIFLTVPINRALGFPMPGVHDKSHSA